MRARRPILILGALVLAIALAACPADDPDEPAIEDPPETPAETPADDPADDPADPDDEVDEEALHPGAPEGHEEPPAPEAERYVLAFDHGIHDGFERVVITTGEDFETETDVPPTVDVQPANDIGAVRIHLEEVVGGSSEPLLQTEGDVLGVHHAGEDLETHWVDVFTDEPVEAQVFRLTDPGRVVIDLVPTDEQWGGPPADQSDFGVLLEPDPRIEHRGDSMLVRGYARPFEAHANIVVTDEDGEVVADQSTSTAMWAEAAGQFELSLDTSDWEPGTYTITVEQTPGHEEGEVVMLETQIGFTE